MRLGCDSSANGDGRHPGAGCGVSEFRVLIPTGLSSTLAALAVVVAAVAATGVAVVGVAEVVAAAEAAAAAEAEVSGVGGVRRLRNAARRNGVNSRAAPSTIAAWGPL